MKQIPLLALLTCAAWAQPAATPPAFEVASVKVAEQPQAQMNGGGAMMFRMTSGCRKPDPGRITCNGATFKQLLMQAYDVKQFQVQGPAWIDQDHFDLNAKIPEGVSADQVPAMLQSLLAERFKAVVHKETKTLPAYEVTVAKGGPKLKEIDAAEVAAAKEAAAQRAAAGPPALPPTPPPPPMPGGRGMMMSAGSMPIGATSMSFNSNGARTIRGKMTLTQLFTSLTNQSGRPFSDQTGLTGTYEIELTYLSDDSDMASTQLRGMMAQAQAMAGAPSGAAGAGGPDAAHQDATTPTATLAQAFQQQLGLKLDAKKAPVEMIVLDSANKVPTEN